MDTEFHWESHNIKIDSQPGLKYLWMATETVVKVDDVEISRVGGFRFTDRITGKFIHNDHACEFVLAMKVDLITLVSVPYEFQIDGNIISQGRLKIKNWPLAFVTPAIFAACVCCPMVFVLFLQSPR